MSADSRLAHLQPQPGIAIALLKAAVMPDMAPSCKKDNWPKSCLKDAVMAGNAGRAGNDGSGKAAGSGGSGGNAPSSPEFMSASSKNGRRVVPKAPNATAGAGAAPNGMGVVWKSCIGVVCMNGTPGIIVGAKGPKGLFGPSPKNRCGKGWAK